jgi:predicted O-methyltransferase YrrM
MAKFGQDEAVKIDWAHAGLIEGLVLSSKPKKILELGVGGGRSLESILTGIEYNGQPYEYTLVDNWGDWGGVMPPEVTELYGEKVHNIITSNEKDFVFSCKEKFDFIMSDADHNRADQWFEYVYDNLLNDNGILIYHDVNMDDHWHGGNFFNLRNIYESVKTKKISHRLFNVSSLPEEQCERGLLVIFKNS